MNDKDAYIELCKEEPNISIYNQSWWLDAVCGKENWDVLLKKDGTTITAAMPIYIKRKAGLMYVTQPDFTQHLGIWFRYPNTNSESKRISYENETINYFLDEVEKKKVVFYYQAQSPQLRNILAFIWRGYKENIFYTYRINDISNVDEVFRCFEHNKRKNINKAKKSGGIIQFDISAETFYKFHKACLEKQGKTISYSQEIFERMYSAAYTHNCGRTIAFVNNGNVECALFNIWDNNWGYDLISAIDPDYKSNGGPDLLVYTMIEFLSSRVKGYDFEGSMIKGVEESFRRFGATQTIGFGLSKIYTNNPIIRMAILMKQLWVKR